MFLIFYCHFLMTEEYQLILIQTLLGALHAFDIYGYLWPMGWKFGHNLEEDWIALRILGWRPNLAPTFLTQDHLGLGQKSGTNLGEPHEKRGHFEIPPSPDDPCGSTRCVAKKNKLNWWDPNYPTEVGTQSRGTPKIHMMFSRLRNPKDNSEILKPGSR